MRALIGDVHEPGHQLLGHLQLRLGRGDPRVGVVGVGLRHGERVVDLQVSTAPAGPGPARAVVEDRGARGLTQMTMGCSMRSRRSPDARHAGDLQAVARSGRITSAAAISTPSGDRSASATGVLEQPVEVAPAVVVAEVVAAGELTGLFDQLVGVQPPSIALVIAESPLSSKSNRHVGASGLSSHAG